ncbi:MAG: NADH-quinone oxidoreductase subunit NuoE [Pseudomonadota bacterium]
MNRRLAPEPMQPKSFAFTPDNHAWAEGQIAKYPEGRQASAVIPLLWRAQEQEGWVTRAGIEHVAEILDMPMIRVLEVATFYFMFKLAPVGAVAHFEICGTTPCMLCGAEKLVDVCKEKIAAKPFELSGDGKFSWEEVECLGACSNAPMAQVGSDYYEDLTAETFAALIDAFGRGERPRPGPQNGRFASEPLGGATTLLSDRTRDENASVALATGIDAMPRMFSGGVPQFDSKDTPNLRQGPSALADVATLERPAPVIDTAMDVAMPRPEFDSADDLPDFSPETAPAEFRPEVIDRPDDGGDDLQRIKGVGPKLAELLNSLGFYRFEQIGAWNRDNVAWVNAHLGGFKGRIDRDNWIEQAKALASE